ncbi:isocitrate lyase/phosphoenolpyruvate mutase family protein [Tersicoccus sp. Bi-70]|uniref:isocitrate lyase/PEP mutase family protein n=1 Tax=Tersicoccus sp. Bi-70 TaxID=1897634 RepID=UPI000977F56A|nr:isocitrate lyase/phosphoenolpyruvate mutase family protein [Tersicoccus sp. Bi-70]OMH35049.1 phosphonomutase [Tersicoccus sp. Bi-70]
MSSTPAARSEVVARAATLARLHTEPGMLVLPTVWDAWSARTAVDAGFTALTIGSHPLADSRGQDDHEGMTLDDALEGIARVCASVDVPVSADVESGYGTPAAELVERVLDAGAVGINVEDTVHHENRVRSVQEHADYIGQLRTAADVAGVELVINARTDAYLHSDEFADPLSEAVTRLQACVEAGARSVYPVRVPDLSSVRTLVDAVSVPVNITANPRTGAPSGSMEELRDAGVRRISYGPLLQAELTRSMSELIQPWAPSGA